MRALKLLLLLSMTMNSLKANTTNPPSCDQTLQACDKAVKALEKTNKELTEGFALEKQTIAEQQAEIGRLRVVNDAWYERQPWLVFALGAVAGGVAYGLLKK
ncbi:MAG: hypothetical protein V4440_00615 [Pseudomonadota bacterium]